MDLKTRAQRFVRAEEKGARRYLYLPSIQNCLSDVPRAKPGYSGRGE